jgi:hypothetical protein
MITPLEAMDALLAAAERKASGYDDLVITGLAASIKVNAAPLTVADIRATRAKLRDAYAADPVGIAAKLLPSLDALFGAVKGIAL